MHHIHSLFPFLNHLISFLFLGFAAGASALADAGGADAAVVANADTGDGAAGGDGTPADGAAAEGTGDGTGAEGAQAGADKKDVQPTIPTDGRQIPAAVRSHLAELKKTNPQLAKELNDYVWGYKQLKAELGTTGVKEIQELRAAFPEGLQEAVALKAAFDQAAGADSVEDFIQEVSDYRALDQKFINGDPEFIQAAVSKYPEGFKKLMPSMMDTWGRVDADAYDRYMASIIVGSLANNGFATNEARAVDYLEMQDPKKENPVIQKAIELLKANQAALDGWNKFARTAPPAPAKDPNAEKNAQEAATLEKQRTEFFVQGLAREFDTHTAQKVEHTLKELKKEVLGDRKLFQGQVIKAMTALLDSEPTFKAKYSALVAAKDHAGALKLLISRSESNWSKVIEQEHKRVYGTAKLGAQEPKPKPAAKPNGAPAAAAKPAQGWVKVDANLDPSLIDRKQTPERDIVFNKKAVLKDGRKVYWGDKIPTA